MTTQLHSTAALARIVRALAFLLMRHTCLWAALVALSALAFVRPPAQAAETEAWVIYATPPVGSAFYGTVQP